MLYGNGVCIDIALNQSLITVEYLIEVEGRTLHVERVSLIGSMNRVGTFHLRCIHDNRVGRSDRGKG